MKLEYDKKSLDEVLKNKVLVNLVKQWNKAYDEGHADKFLDENPEFLQMMMHNAEKINCKVIE